MKNKKFLKYLCLFFVLIVWINVSSCSEKIRMKNSKYDKVLLIGIDGMDPKIMGKLMEEDKLPNLKKLSEGGTFINLNTSFPPHSPVAWTSIATGTNPAKHNIFDFIRRNPSNYLPELSLTKTVSGIAGTNYEPYVKTDPFWRITSKLNIPSTVIRWPVTFPPEKVEGNLLSGLGVPDIKGFLSGYAVYTSKDISSDKPSNKIIKVNEENGVIKTEIFGPRTKKSGKVVEIGSPITIKLLEDSVEIAAEGKNYNVKINEWSDWIRVKFKAGILKNVYGTFKAYIVNLDPFEMYVTAIQIDPENPMAPISYPKDYSSSLAKEIGLFYTLGMPEETDGLIDGKLSEEGFLKHIDEIEEERDKMFWKEFESFNEGVYAFVYDSSDRLQHVFWDQKLLEGEKLKISKPVEEHFIEKDKFIGEVLEKMDEDTLLLIISDHGFTSYERSVSMNTWLVENGFMKLTKNIDQIGEGSLFKYVDWSNTKAYSLGFNSIYINVKGREGKGIVENREEVVEEIINKLEELEDLKYNKKVVNKAYKREEIYNGELIGDAPDIVIGYNPGYRMAWQTAIGGFTEEILLDNTKIWDGDHLVDPQFVPGVLFSNIKLDKDSVSQMDIAPTVLDSLGIEIPSEIDGKSLLR